MHRECLIEVLLVALKMVGIQGGAGGGGLYNLRHANGYKEG